MNTEQITKLKRRGSKDLQKKIEGGKCTEVESAAIVEILSNRGISVTAKPVAEVEEGTVASPPTKTKSSDKVSMNPDITSDFLKVGDFETVSTRYKGTVTAKVVKIYSCNRTKKPYVRLVDKEGNKFHKLLAYFKPE